MIRIPRSKAAVFLVLSALLAGAVVGDSFVIQAIISSVEASDWRRFGILSTFAVMYAIMHGLLYLWQNIYSERLSNAVTAQMRDTLFRRIERMPLQAAADTPADLYFSTLTTQLDSVKRDLVDVLLWGTYLMMQLLFSVIAVLAINPTLGGVALLLCIPMSLVPVISKRFVIRARNAMTGSADELNTVTGDLLHGIVDWRLTGKERNVHHRFAQLNETWLQAADHDATVQKQADSANNFMTNILIFGVWIVGGLLIMRGTMSVAQVVAFFSLVGNISVPLFYTSGLFAQFNAGRAVLAKVNGTIEETSQEDQEHETDAAGSNKDIQGIDTITYRDVRFHTQKHAGRQPVNLQMNTNKRYLIVGPSGAGKSSLIRPLFSLDTDYTGNILVNGTDITDPVLGALGQSIGLLSQSSHIFHASIRENVRLMDESIDDRTIFEACHAAVIDEWVGKRGLDYVIDDDLRTLSGGERQRILLARLLVRGQRFCVFDELTTGLDHRTAQQVEQTIFDTIPGFIYITHRLNETVLTNSDTIVVIEDMQIKAQGNYDQVRRTLLDSGLLETENAPQSVSNPV